MRSEEECRERLRKWERNPELFTFATGDGKDLIQYWVIRTLKWVLGEK